MEKATGFCVIRYTNYVMKIRSNLLKIIFFMFLKHSTNNAMIVFMVMFLERLSVLDNIKKIFYKCYARKFLRTLREH